MSQLWDAAIKWLQDNPKTVLGIEVLASLFTIIGTVWLVCRFIFHVSLSSIAKMGLGIRLNREARSIRNRQPLQ